MNQSLLEMWESFAVWVPQEMTALKESRLNIKVLSWRGPRRRRWSRVETRWAHPSEVIIVADWLLLAADFHFFVLLISVFPMDLFELHCNLAELLKGRSSEHYLFDVVMLVVKELLHHNHVVDDKCVKSLKIPCWVKLHHQVNFERSVVDRFAAFRVLIGFIATANDDITKVELKNEARWKIMQTHQVHTPLMNAHGWNVSNRRLLFSQILFSRSTHSFSSTQLAACM